MAQEYPTKIQIQEGIEMLLSHTEKKEAEIIETESAYGRILAQEIKSQENIPPFDRSPYDGYAIRSVDVASAFHVPSDCPVPMLFRSFFFLLFSTSNG